MKLFAGPAIAVLMTAALAACEPGTPDPEPDTPVVEPTTESESERVAAPDYAAIVADESRLPQDVENDASRKPVETLEFAGIQTGMTVYDMESGGGYTAALISRAVGPEGKVYMQNPESFSGFIGTALTDRIAGGLSNAEIITSQFDDLQAPDASVDVVTWSMGPHELYYTPDGAPDGLGDVEGTYAEIYRILKPGGAFVTIDHVAPEGSPPTTGGETHRIDPAHVQAAAEAAGFVLEAEAAFLANPEDPHTTGVFDPSIIGQTDRFVHRYRKQG